MSKITFSCQLQRYTANFLSLSLSLEPSLELEKVAPARITSTGLSTRFDSKAGRFARLHRVTCLLRSPRIELASKLARLKPFRRGLGNLPAEVASPGLEPGSKPARLKPFRRGVGNLPAEVASPGLEPGSKV